MKRRDFPILEFDPTRRAVIEPSEQIRPSDVPVHCVPCLFGDVTADLVERGAASERRIVRQQLERVWNIR